MNGGKKNINSMQSHESSHFVLVPITELSEHHVTCTHLANFVFSGGMQLFLLTFLMTLLSKTEAAVKNTTPQKTINVDGGDTITLLCTYTGIDPDSALDVHFRRWTSSRYIAMWVYKGNSTHATTDGPTAAFEHLSMKRVNNGFEQFNMSLQISYVTLDDANRYYHCTVNGITGAYTSIILDSGRFKFCSGITCGRVLNRELYAQI